MSIATSVHKVSVQNETNVFYREAGSPSKPTILLLHGYPTSSNMFRNLIPLLAPHFHVIAPDIPGFGFTELPSSYKYDFANLADTIDLFVQALKLKKFAIYIFDYGAPVGLRLALKDPTRITAIVSQNGNAYEEGIDDRFWKPIREYWKTDEHNAQFVDALSKFIEDPVNIVSQYVHGVKTPDSIDPGAYLLDEALLKRSGQTAIQLGLFYDYKTNVDLYPQFQNFLRGSNIPVLLAWGKNDIIFNVDGAEAYKRDAKNLKIVYFDTGHFALESHVEEISKEIVEFVVPQL